MLIRSKWYWKHPEKNHACVFLLKEPDKDNDNGNDNDEENSVEWVACDNNETSQKRYHKQCFEKVWPDKSGLQNHKWFYCGWEYNAW